jgi:hypothetical protein
MKYHGEVLSKHGRFITVDANSGRSPLVCIRFEDGDRARLVSLSAEDASELARHLKAAANEIIIGRFDVLLGD